MRSYCQRPLISVAITAGVGSFSGVMIPMPFPVALLSCASALLVFAVLLRNKGAAGWLLMIAVFTLFWIRSDYFLRHETDLEQWGKRRSIVFIGQIEGFPEYDGKAKQWHGVFTCQRIEYREKTYSVKAKVRFSAKTDAKRLIPFQKIKIHGRCMPITPPMNPGEFDYRTFMLRRGIGLQIYGTLTASERTDLFWTGVGHVREWLQSNIRNATIQQASPLLLAMTIGCQTNLDPWEREKLTISGLAHIIAISGLHVGILYLGVYGAWIGIGLKRKWGIFAALLIVGLWVCMTGMKMPILRSFIMLMGVTIAGVFHKKSCPFSGLALAVILILIIHPCAIMEAGFQLSLAATASILHSAQWIIRLKQRGMRIFRWLGQMLVISTAAFIAVTPIVLFHFYQVTPWAILGNVLAIPLVGITVLSGILAGFFGQVPFLGKSVGLIASWGAIALTTVSNIIMQIPGHRVFLRPMPGFWVVLYYIVFTILLKPVCKAHPKASEIVTIIRIPLAIGLIVFFAAYQIIPFKKNYSVKATFLSLNIGESTLVETGSGRHLLIDTGTEQEFYRKVKPFLAQQGINLLDGVILSHADTDHAGGLKACLEFFKVKHLLYNGQTFVRYQANNVIEEIARKRGTQIHTMGRGQYFSFGHKTRIDAVWPPSGSGESGNGGNLAFTLTCEDEAILFTGDAPGGDQRQWDVKKRVRCYKAAHHGDANTNDVGLLTYLQPDIAIVMPGNRNRFGFPDERLMQRLRLSSGVVLDTACLGAVEVYLYSNGTMYWQAAR